MIKIIAALRLTGQKILRVKLNHRSNPSKIKTAKKKKDPAKMILKDLPEKTRQADAFQPK